MSGIDYTTLVASEISEKQWFNCVFRVVSVRREPSQEPSFDG